MRRRTSGAVLANPVLVGAVTVLVIIVAVFLAYNANQGLPFVPTFELKADVPSGAKLVAGNEVREGGYRVGVVSAIQPKKLPDGTAGAQLVLKLDKKATPLPADTTIKIRPRSALGLKYVELERGTAKDTLTDGQTISAGKEALAPELQEFFNIFDEKTRENAQRNLVGYGNGLAFRGADINRALESLPRFFRELPPVMRTLADPDTRLERFFDELADAARISAPLAETMADGFAAGADTFAALSRDPQALKDTIAESPPTLEVGTRALREQRPFLDSLAAVSGDLRGAAAALRTSAPEIERTLRAGVEPLRQSPALNRRLDDSFDALGDLAAAPTTDIGVGQLVDLTDTLNPQLRYLGPYVTVCNYWNAFWTFFADHLTDEDQTGTMQRIQAKSTDGPQADLDSFGESKPVPGYHGQYYNAAIDDQGNADCEAGQRGYPRRLAAGAPPEYDIAVDPETPGNQGPTFFGRPKTVPGQTFSRLPERAPRFRP